MTVFQRSHVRSITLVLAVALFLLGTLDAAAHVAVWGPKSFTIASNQTTSVRESFTRENGCSENAQYWLIVDNGATDGAARVSSAAVRLNGVAVVSPSDFNQQIGRIERLINLADANSLEIDLKGGPSDGRITVAIYRHINLVEPVLPNRTLTSVHKHERFEIAFSADRLADAFSLTLASSVPSILKSATATLNGTALIGVSDWRAGVSRITTPVTLQTSNILILELDTDSAGASVSVKVDRHLKDITGPAVVTNPASGAVVPNGAITVQGTITDPSGVSSVLFAGHVVTLSAGGAFSVAVALVPGANRIPISATDCEGNTTQQELVLTLDAAAPTITVTNPAVNAFVLTRDVLVEGTVDGGTGTTLTIEGQSVPLSNGQFHSSITLSPESVGVFEGPRTISVIATDLAGRASTVLIPVVVDLSPPIIVASSKTNGWTNQPAAVSFFCQDAGSGIQSCPVPTIVSTEGADQAVSGTAADFVGRTATAATTVSVDLGTPVLVVADVPAEVTAETIELSIHATDTLSGIRRVTCNGGAATRGPASYTCSPFLIEGANTIAVRAEDFAGNIASDSVHLLRDATPPTLAIEMPDEGTVTHAPFIEISGTVADEHALSAVLVDGQPLAVIGSTFTASRTLADGENVITITARDTAGNETTRSRLVTRIALPVLVITTPLDLAIVNASVVTVTGTVDGAATVVVNGTPATITGTAFRAENVGLQQGRTVITAIATTTTGRITAANTIVYRDSLPPRVTVYAPTENAITTESSVTVSGMVDDIVVGTINAGQVQVSVNGQPAAVANRSFVAPNIPLGLGPSIVTILATDQAGNTATQVVHITRDASPSARIERVSGDVQTAPIGTPLAQPLVVRLSDPSGSPAAGRVVTYRVLQNNGRLESVDSASDGRTLSVTTNAQGLATAQWTLGTRAGAGNQRVDVAADGFGHTEFTASGLPGVPALIVADSGLNQYGIIGAPIQRPLVAVVVDQGSNRLADVPVTFTVADGEGSINGQSTVTVRTDTDGRAWVTPHLGPRTGTQVFTAQASNATSIVGFPVTARPAGLPGDTHISGVVLDNLNAPIFGVSLRIEGSPVTAQTDEQGRFTLLAAPVGYVKLLVDGTTAQRPGTWPTLEFALYTNPGQDNTIGMPIYLLPLDLTRGVQVDERTGGNLTFPELPGFSLTIAPGSALFPGGSRAGTVSVTLVHADKMPMPPGFGQQPRFLVTIQPTGVHFDPPAAISFPNLDGLAAGEITEMYSFDHDLGQFVAIGTASVSEDGSTLQSDPGVGIIKGGWHCGGNPAPSGTCDACAGGGQPGSTLRGGRPIASLATFSPTGCKKSNGTACVPDPAQNGKPCKDDGDPCTEERCLNGICQHVPMGASLTARYVDRDDPTRDWGDSSALALGQPLYASDTVGDFVSWKAGVTTLQVNPTSYKWKASGPEVISGPSGPEWRIDGIKWKPGFYNVEVEVTFATGCKLKRIWGQSVGVRTDDILVVAWINGANVPLITTGVVASVLDVFPPEGLHNASKVKRLIAFTYLGTIAAGGDARPFSEPDDSLSPADRLYILDWLFKFGANEEPPFSFPSDLSLDVFHAEITNYKLYNRLQVKYQVNGGALVNVFPLKRTISIGWTIDPIWELPVPGAAGPHDEEFIVTPDEIHQVNDGTPDIAAVLAFETLMRPLKWSHIGSKIRFRLGDTEAEVKAQVFPTYFTFTNKVVTAIRPQAPNPSDVFTSTPYPPGPPFPPFIYQP